MAFSPDGSRLVIGSIDGTIHFFSTDDWSAVGRPIEAHAARVTSLDFSPDGRVLATAGADGTVALWDVATRKPIGTPLDPRARDVHFRRLQPGRLAPLRGLDAR